MSSRVMEYASQESNNREDGDQRRDLLQTSCDPAASDLSIPIDAFLGAAVSLKDQLVEMTWKQRGNKGTLDPSVYTGLMGTAFMCLRSYEATGDRRDLQLCAEIVDTCAAAGHKSNSDVTFLSGRGGVYALGAITASFSGDQKKCDFYLDGFLEMAQERALPVGPEEGGFGMSYDLLHGRAGFLWAALFINKHLGAQTVPNDLLMPVVGAVLAGGRAGASDNTACPLMYRWHGTRYWGAAHGLAGILHVLLHFPLSEEDIEDVKATLGYMMSNRFPHSGNYPVSEGNPRDKLVQWSHGAGGMAITLCKASQICIRSVASIWAETKKRRAEGESVKFTATKWSKHKYASTIDYQKMESIPVKKRCTLRKLAKVMGTSKSSAGRWVKSEQIRAHTNAIKPYLTHIHMLQRLRFSLSSLHYDRAVNIVKYREMHHTVHIDEKWFYITKECERYYLTPNEVEPHRTCKSKRYITKLMFMCAVARPLYSCNGELLFDGKIGIFPFTKEELAKRNSKNRLKGTPETKPIESITKEVIKGCLINQVIPAIKAKWPSMLSKQIIIQQDNAKPHIDNTDMDFEVAANSDGFNINLICQPANSPDTNINDLGWFRSIQSLQTETASKTVDDLVESVKSSFERLTAETLNNVFLSLQGCLTEILKCKGGNSYKLPHMNKARLIREGTLPENLTVDVNIVKEALDYLKQEGNDIDSTYDVESLERDLMEFSG